MPESPARQRRLWADAIVILMGLLLIALAAWPARPEDPAREVASLGSMYMGYGIAGGLTLVAVFLAQRSRAVGRIIVAVAAAVLLLAGLRAYPPHVSQLWLTVVAPAALLLVALPFFGPMPRARR